MSSPFNAPHKSWLLMGSLLFASAVGVLMWSFSPTSNQPVSQKKEASPPALPELAVSPYLNTKPKARSLGSHACRDCHQEEYAAFQATPHYQALQQAPLENEPPDGEFDHESSGRSYRVYRKGGQLWHREVIKNRQDDELVLGDYPVAYRIGSGHHSRSYLIDIDGYLLESPITWYASTGRWALSPGYDVPVHDGFFRPAHEGCVRCHAGRVEAEGGSTHRLRFHEMQIGCESCHGPGSLHVDFRSGPAELPPKRDLTIVHPGKLPRALNEAICARCHLSAAASASVRGRHINEFRPGLPLTDYRIDYATGQDSQSMTVVGHFEQMRQSACYLQSETLTCTSCHNPHHRPEPATKVEYYRQKCLSCHKEPDGGCRLPESKRLSENPANDCTACHMPKSNTNIPHFAFTHHRIGRTHVTAYQKRTASANLVPVEMVSHLPDLDRERCLGLASLHYAEKQTGPEREQLLNQAFLHLNRAYEGGLQDAPVTAGLAYLFWNQDDRSALPFAERALEVPDCEPDSKVNALIILGDMNLRQGNFSLAKRAFEQLTTIRLRVVDWQMLGVCRLSEDDPKGAVAALRKALSLQPDQYELYGLLAEAQAKAGDEQAAERTRQKAEKVRKLLSR